MVFIKSVVNYIKRIFKDTKPLIGEWFEEASVLLIIAVSISGAWMLSELVIEGKIEENVVDTVIALVLSVSLYKNYKYYKAKKEFLEWLKEKSEQDC